MYTVICSPTHVLPLSFQAPTLKDDVTGAFEFRRKLTRPLRTWEMVVPGVAPKLEDLQSLILVAQGDTPAWFDGAGMIEVTEPALVGIGTGAQTDFRLPDRYVNVNSAVIYLNGAATNAWQPLGGDGVWMDQIRFTGAPANFAQIKAKYRRKAKVVIVTDSDIGKDRGFRHDTDPRSSIYSIKVVLQECPN